MNNHTSHWLTIQVMLVSALVLAFALALGVCLYTNGWDEGFDEGVEAGRQIAYNLGYDEGYADGRAPYQVSSNTTISMEKALGILEEGKQNHLAWANRPDLIVLQDKNTGDTAFNDLWVKNYTDLEDFIKWLASQSKE